MSERVFYGYVDRTSDGRPFYVGKGLVGRVGMAFRNQKHGRVSAKHGRVRTIEFASSVESLVFEWEREAIVELGTFSGTGIGCNFTRGGEGAAGCAHSPEAVERSASSHRGSRRSEEARARMSAASKGKSKRLEHRLAIASGKRGVPKSLEHRERIAASVRRWWRRTRDEGARAS